jgi:site-specific DNA-methyltransferase (adenine-specific)
MQPYFSDDAVTLYLGDCREITDWLTADVLVSDPPYGMAYVSNRSKHGPTTAISGDADPLLRNEVLAIWGDRPALVFGTWRIPQPSGIRHLLVWDKGDNPGTGDLAMPWGNSAEEIYVLGRGWVGKRGPNVLRFNTLAPQASYRPDHPTPKPVALMETLIAKCPSGVIADPFAGSGATLVAARNQGRRSIGVELDERYCEFIAKRLSQGVLPLESAS